MQRALRLAAPRSARSARCLRACALLIALLAARAADAANGEDTDETERWVPSFSLQIDAFAQKAQGSVKTGPVLGPPMPLLPESPPQIRPDTESSDTSVAPALGGTLELMSPRLLDAAWRPRLFAHVDLLGAIGFDRNLAGEMSPGEFGVPPLPPTVTNVQEAIIQGQGSRTTGQVQPFVLGAGAGVAFSVDWLGRRIRIKPSIEYLREEFQFQGRVHRAVKLVNPTPNQSLDNFRLITLDTEKTKAYHGIGPGIEVEVDTVYAGPFLLAVYANGRAFHLLGDREVEFSKTNEFGETADYTAEPDAWGWGGGVGLRFRWLPPE